MKPMEKKREKKEFFPTLHTNLSEMFDLDKFFNERFFETPVWNKGFLNRNSYYNRFPATNIRETDSEFIFEMAVPGMDKKDFHIDVNNDLLEIKVEKEEQFKEETSKFTRMEYDYTNFFRTFSIPEFADPDKIKAEYLNGMLKVFVSKLPKAQMKPVKEIPVK